MTKEEIREAVFNNHYKQMKEEMKPLKKLDSINGDLSKPQTFMNDYNLDECKMAMRLKTRMMDIPEAMPGRYRGREGCRACSPRARGEEGPEEYESRAHLEFCGGYKLLWGDEMTEKEVVKFFMRLMKTRKELMMRKLSL